MLRVQHGSSPANARQEQKDRHRQVNVNNLLHTLRGEHFRHAQNIRGSRPHLATPPRAPRDSAGPTAVSEAEDAARRAHALSLVFSHLAPSQWSAPASQPARMHVPPLALLCLLHLRTSLAPLDFAVDVVPHMPAHLRRALIRHCAVYDPLPNALLHALCEPAGHADGELLVMGPRAALRSGHFGVSSTASDAGTEIQSWDAAITDDAPSPLTTLVLFSTPLPVSMFLTLPASLTHLALLGLPRAIPLHRLPGLCPLLAVLDLSYNAWLDKGTLLGVGWRRWSRLKVLGLRECGFAAGEESVELRRAIVVGRWEDVEIVWD